MKNKYTLFSGHYNKIQNNTISTFLLFLHASLRKFLLSMKAMSIVVILLLVLGSVTKVFGQATFTSRSDANWNVATTWTLNSGSDADGIPDADDIVYMANTFDVTVTANAACASVTFTGAAAKLTVNSTFTLTVSGDVTLNNAAGTSNACTISGSGSLSCASVVVGGTITNLNNDQTTIMTSTISDLSISGNLSINGEDDGSDDNNSTFALQSGSVTVNGSVILDDENNDCNATLTLASGAQTGTLSILGATPFIITTSPTFSPNGTSATVIYAGASQTIYAVTYHDLTISGSGTKTLGGTTTTSGLLTMTSGTLDMANTNLSVGSLTGSGDITNTTGTAGNRTFTIGSDNTSPAAFTGTINNGTATQVTVTKTGTGILTLAGAGDNVGLAVTGSAGTVVLAKASDGGVHAVGGGGLTTNGGTVQLGGSGGDQLYYGSNLTLNGGTFSTGATTGFSEAIAGVLTLSANSTIALATGVHTLAIENSSTANWGAFTLTITGWTGGYDGTASATAGRIFFGTTSGGLTAGQLAKIRFFDGTNNYRAAILSTGEVVPATSTYYAIANTAWNVNTTWSYSSGGTAVGTGFWPGAGDVVFIGDAASARAVTIPSGYTANCASIAIGNSSNNTANSLTLSAAASVLNVSGNITINRVNGASTNALNVNAGNALVNGSVTFAGTNTGTGRINTVVITTGTLSISGDLVFVAGIAATNVLTMSGGAGTLNLGGSWTGTVGTFTPGATSTFVYNGTTAQTVNTSFGNYNHLKIDNAAGVSLNTATTITRLLTMADGTLNMANNNLTVGSLTGSGNITNTTGTAGARTIAVGSDNTSPLAYSGIISNGTATSVALTKSGSGTLILSGVNTFTGTTTITGGTLMLGASDVLADGSPVTLSGGTLSTGSGAGFSETIGAVALSATSTIALGTGVHALTIANSSGAIWGAFTLNINGWTGLGGAGGTATAGKIMVGAGGLSVGQLAKVTFGGYAAGSVITSSGELVPNPAAIYYSNGNVAPNTLASWKTARDGTGTSPSNFTTAGVIYVVQNGDAMTTNNTWTITGANVRVLIENGGTLQANNTITLATTGYFQIDNGGTYRHNNNSIPSTTIFNGTEIFGASSNVRIDNWINASTVITTGVTLPFGNLELNWTGNTNNWQQAWTTSFTLCAGNFRVTSLGSGTLRFNANTPSPTITISGSYFQTGGTIDLSSGTSLTTLNVAGDFTHTGGTIIESSTGSGSGSIVFNGTSIQNYASGGTVTNTVNFTVNNGSTLYIGTSLLGNGSGGTFSLLSGGTLGIGDAGGIATSGATGNIRVNGTRTYNAGANYIYNGSVDQVTGNGLTQNTPADLTINSSKTVSLSNAITMSGNLLISQGTLSTSANNINIAGNWTNNGGTFTPGAGTVTFNGATQTINDITTTDAPFNTLIISSSSSTTLNSNAKLSDRLQITSGKLIVSAGKSLDVQNGTTILDAPNCLLLKADPMNVKPTASFIDNGTINYSLGGSTQVECFITKYGDKFDKMFHFLSSPVASEPIATQFSNPSGNTTDDFYKFNESTYEWINYRNAAGTGINTSFGESNFAVGRGYLVAYSESSTKTFTGALNTGDRVLPSLTYNASLGVNKSGWNLLGNPYPSAIDWDKVEPLQYSSLDNAVYVYDNINFIYKSYLGGAGSLTNGIIPAMQGFFVHTNNALPIPSLTLENADRVHDGTLYYKSNSDINIVQLKIEGNGRFDETYIRFNDAATAAFDGDWDAYKLYGGSSVPTFYTLAGEVKLSVNSLPMSSLEGSVPLAVEAGADTTYSISLVENSLPSNTYVKLEDLKTGIVQKLNDNPMYTFNAAPGDDPNRFLLHFVDATSVPDPTTRETFTVSQSNGTISIITQQTVNAEIRVCNMLGQVVLRGQTNGNSLTMLNANSLPNGVYVVSLVGNNKVVSEKIVVGKR